MNKPEEFVFTQAIKCADCDGKPIQEGSVLREINDGDTGVVIKIIRPTDKYGPMCSAIGDLVIQTRVGSSRVTNRYNQWKHVPHNEQTYEQRFWSWLQKEYVHDTNWSRVSKAEGRAIDGIMNLLPDDTVNWEYGPCPDTLDDALRFLVKYLESLAKKL